MKRIVFLDIDGVLNSEPFLAERVRIRNEMREKGQLQEPRHPLVWWSEQIDTASVLVLNQILEKSGADVVMSSAWRCMLEPEPMREVLVSRGFRGKIIGSTPELWSKFGRNEIILPACRGDEIQAWLDHHPADASLILDDRDDMGKLRPWLLQIDPMEGLREKHVGPALERLGVTP